VFKGLEKYWLVWRMSLLDAIEYRADLLLRASRYALNIILISMVWIAISKSGASLGLSSTELIRYYFITAMLYSLSNFHTEYVEQDVRLGHISKYFVKPISIYWYYFLYQASIAFIESLLKVIVLLPVLYFMHIALSFSLVNIALFLLTMPLIFMTMFSLYFGISGMTFWFQAVDALRMSVMFLFRFTSGIFVPLLFLPLVFQELSKWLPFGYMAFFPIQLLEGHLSPIEVIRLFSTLGIWLVIFFLFQKIIWHKATHSYESTGI
jgi:ABC-2 type transport system permease protein